MPGRLKLLGLVAVSTADAARKKPKPPKGPSMSVVRDSVLGVPRKANPNEPGNVNDAGGPVWIFPARANLTLVLPQDDDPSDDTYCMGTWVNEQFTFYRDAAGKWAWFSESIDVRTPRPARPPRRCRRRAPGGPCRRGR